MPRQVDHEERRRVIAEAVCRLADESGLEGVTVRDVAERAGLSMGAVQRCFRTKEEMLVFALGHVGEQIGRRVRERLVGSPAQSAASAVGYAAEELALLRAGQRSEARVWLAFVAQAAVSGPLAGTLRTGYAAMEELLVRLLTEAGAQTGVDAVEREARTLLALVDGLTTHVLIGRLTERQAEEVLHAHLGGLWTHCARSTPRQIP
ncbi:TetR/AcrR family transcriptional regulator [Kitasatospora sp. NPDC093806]|uniref:TetR/AcrR family transcriptional regulator n=1 Tax=Kitasatospora sp. NPDC093806 TaxID=3155075 RepID=UPI0034331F6F